MDLFTYVIILYALMIGIVIGTWLQRLTMNSRLRSRAADGSVEYIGNRQFVYVMDSEEYRKIFEHLNRYTKL